MWRRRRVAKDEAIASLEGVALMTGVLSLFAFTIAASVVGVALLVASYWGEDRASDRESRDEGEAQRAKGRGAQPKQRSADESQKAAPEVTRQ